MIPIAVCPACGEDICAKVHVNNLMARVYLKTSVAGISIVPKEVVAGDINFTIDGYMCASCRKSVEETEIVFRCEHSGKLGKADDFIYIRTARPGSTSLRHYVFHKSIKTALIKGLAEEGLEIRSEMSPIKIILQQDKE